MGRNKSNEKMQVFVLKMAGCSSHLLNPIINGVIVPCFSERNGDFFFPASFSPAVNSFHNNYNNSSMIDLKTALTDLGRCPNQILVQGIKGMYQSATKTIVLKSLTQKMNNLNEFSISVHI